MGTLTVNATNGQTVIAGASYVVPLPSGKSLGNYHTAGATITTSDGSVYPVTVSFGALGITVTNPTGRDIASGGFDFIDLQTAGILARFNASGETDVVIGPKNTEASLVTATVDPASGVISVAESTGTLLSSVDVTAYGVKCDGKAVAGFTVTGSGNTGACTATVDTWVPADVGKAIVFHKPFAAASMANYAVSAGTITAVAGPRNCTISSTSCPTYTSTSPYASAVFGTENLDAINAAIAALSLTSDKGSLFFPSGITLCSPYRNARANSTSYPTVGTARTRNTPNGFYYKVVIPGVSGAAEPTYVDTFGATFTDGTVTWMCMGRTTIVLPNGMCLRGRGRATALPYGFATTGSVILGVGYDGFASGLVIVGSGFGAGGNQTSDITVDAATYYASAIAIATKGTTHTNISAMGGTSSAFNNADGTTETIGCQFMARFTTGAVALRTAGDANHLGGVCAGAGSGSPNIYIHNGIDDCKVEGIHIYKGGWSIDLATVPGPNIKMDSVTAIGTTGGGNIVGNTFDTCLGNHIELYVSGATSDGISALTIANNQFYQPQEAFTTNTYAIIKIEATATAPALAYTGLSISGNVAKGTPLGKQYAAFINFVLNSAGQFAGNTIGLNSVNNCAARYTGATLPDFVTNNYSGGNVTRTTEAAITIG